MLWLVYIQMFEVKSLTYSLAQSFANVIPGRLIETIVEIKIAGHVSVPLTLYNAFL